MKVAKVKKEERFVRDYSLTGVNVKVAEDKGLASAVWYTCKVSSKEMKALLERRDEPAIRDTIIWFSLILLTGLIGGMLWGSWWAIFPFAVYGLLYAGSSDSRWHECSHGTVFKTDWMNNVLYEIASFMVFRESTYWRYSHARHHSDTIILGRDNEIPITRPCSLFKIVRTFFAIDQSWGTLKNLFTHAMGKIQEGEKGFIPLEEHAKLISKAQITLSIYAFVLTLAYLCESFLPLMYIGLPTLYGSWLMLVYGYTQHAGLVENVLDHRLNSRTVYMNRVNRFLYWNMNYHIEHHMFPLVPYYNLPKLHELIKHDCPPPYPSLWSAWKEVIVSFLLISENAEVYIERVLPDGAYASHVRHAPDICTAKGEPDNEGWVVVDAVAPHKEEVIRFDHEQRSYAIYRNAEGQLYGTDGICTHGNSHLAEGMVKGNQIECAKHNGRFDMRDGSCKRSPVCVKLRTNEVKEVEGQLLFKLDLTEKQETQYRFKVVSNENIATYIKELVLEPTGAIPNYQPGEYLQIDIPPYPPMSLKNIELSEPIQAIWKSQGVFEHTVENKVYCKRNYSLASNPELDRQFKFNIRLATAPKELSTLHGIGSSFVFSLKQGDEVITSKPYGDFHVKNNDREKVYIGGGAGMAPLKSHLSYLLESLQSDKKISFWYGARSSREVFYLDYFKDLEAKFPNFRFHLVLSEPELADTWKGPTGYIHTVLEENYLQGHHNPSEIDYYLCGPPVMVEATQKMLIDLGVSKDSIANDAF